MQTISGRIGLNGERLGQARLVAAPGRGLTVVESLKTVDLIRDAVQGSFAVLRDGARGVLVGCAFLASHVQPGGCEETARCS